MKDYGYEIIMEYLDIRDGERYAAEWCFSLTSALNRMLEYEVRQEWTFHPVAIKITRKVEP